MQVQKQQLQVSIAAKEQQALQAAVKTIRRTGLYGCGTSVNVEYPTASDLLQMGENIPNNITDLKYLANGDCFFAFQVTLSNGISSPVFKADGANDQNMQSFNIPDYSLVKRVNGTKQEG